MRKEISFFIPVSNKQFKIFWFINFKMYIYKAVRIELNLISTLQWVLVYKEAARDWLTDPLATFKTALKRCQFLSKAILFWSI